MSSKREGGREEGRTLKYLRAIRVHGTSFRNHRSVAACGGGEDVREEVAG